MTKLRSCLLFLTALVFLSFPPNVTAKIPPGTIQGFTFTVYNKSDRCVNVTSGKTARDSLYARSALVHLTANPGGGGKV